MENKIKKVGISIAIISLILFNTYSNKVLRHELPLINNKDPLIVYKNDVDEYINFKTFIGEITSKEDKEKVMNYILNRKIRRIIVPLEPFFNAEFDKTRIMPRYHFSGYMRGFELWGNQYVCIYDNHRHKYYRFDHEFDIKELDKMLELKEFRN